MPFRGMVLGLFASVLVACSVSHSEPEWNPAEATVFRIDRICASHFTVSGPDRPTEMVSNTYDCQMSRSFLDTASRQSGRANLIHGTATVKFTYIAPQDHSQRTAELTFDSGEDPFYTLKAGDKIKILVARTDPEKIRIA